MHEQPKFSEMFMAYLLGRSSRIEEDLNRPAVQFERESASPAFSFSLANFGKSGSSESIVGKISQEVLAEMIGTTRSRVSYFMNKFRKHGFIAYDGGIKGGIEVHSSLLNVVLTESAAK